MNRPRRSSPVLEFLILTGAFIGFSINLLLLFRRLSDATSGILGCGGASCEEVLASRWSLFFGVPVTFFGMLAYGTLMYSLTESGGRLHKPLLGVIAGAGCWFVFVQAVLLEKFCLWCMAAHGAGLAVLVFSLIRLRRGTSIKQVAIFGAVAFLGIGLAQVYGPVPASHRIENSGIRMAEAPVQARGEGRKATFDGDRKTYNVRALPHIGPEDAKHVLVEYFDYQCPACRTMAGYLDALTTRYPAGIAILLLPMPLDGVCNRHVSAENQHPGSCGIARIALAVWREKPGGFAAFHRALLAEPSLDKARRLASGIIPSERMAAALADPWIDELIQADVEDWHAFSKTVDKLPKLLIRDKRILHGLPSGEADFIRVMAQELGLQ